ncbi:glutaminase A [Devosia aurantiaca]
MTELQHDAQKLQTMLDDIVSEVTEKAPKLFEEATQIAEDLGKPKPRKADFDRFGIAVFTRDGALVKAGNAGTGFPIQSISKVFALEVALEALGESLWKRVGREPSGDAFNSIIDLERQKGIPRNPFINSGALVVVDALLDVDQDPNGCVMRFVEHHLDGEKASYDKDVMESDRTGGNLNRSLMFMAKHHGNLKHEVAEVMEAYVHQCAITLDCAGLAKAGRFLMHERPDERSERPYGDARRGRRVLSIMMMCGMYDGSGDFSYRVGLPAKSGVGGGILAIAPHTASIAAWSPALDPMGNSWLGVLGLELLAKRTDWSVFGRTRG